MINIKLNKGKIYSNMTAPRPLRLALAGTKFAFTLISIATAIGTVAAEVISVDTPSRSNFVMGSACSTKLTQYLTQD